MKILIPTDFSKLSKVAVLYAANMAKRLGAEIILLHIVYIAASPRAQVAMKEKQILDAMADNATQKFVQLSNEIKKEVGSVVKVTPQIEKGHPVENVVGNFRYQYRSLHVVFSNHGYPDTLDCLLNHSTAKIKN